MSDADKSHRKRGSKGGQRTRDLYGTEHFEEAGAIGGEVVLERRGVEWFRELGRRSAEARRNRKEAA